MIENTIRKDEVKNGDVAIQVVFITQFPLKITTMIAHLNLVW